MLLYTLPHSPFVRKVRVAARELGLAGRIREETAHVFDPATPLLAANPTGKVPALVREDGSVLYDSGVICEFLDALAGGGRIFPPAGEARWRALRLEALADGLGQAATWNIRERYRPEGERSPRYLAYYERALVRCLDAVDAEVAGFGDGFGIGEIAAAAALSYVDLRYPERPWRAKHRALGAWYDRVALRPSMLETALGPYAGPLQPPL
jgi:glutathione S-transferase